MTARKSGTLFGIGLGPGDPELMTLKAARILSNAKLIAHFRKKGRPGHARTIADAVWPDGAHELCFEYPVTTEIDFRDDGYVQAISNFYSSSASELASHLEAGADVALLCEGDPLFYGSFLHMYDRLKPTYEVVIVPGITGMSGCWTAARAPITYGDDVMSVLPGTLGAQELITHLRAADAAVIMKVGHNLAKIKDALREARRFDDAIYVERGTMSGEKVMRLCDLPGEPVPYFSIILVPGGRGRRIA